MDMYEKIMRHPAHICIVGYKEPTLNYQNALKQHGHIVALPLTQSSVFHLLGDPYAIRRFTEHCDLLLLPGGGDIDPSFFYQPNIASKNIEFMLDYIQFLFLEAYVTACKPVIGVCKGMQLINIFFGGDLCQDMSPNSLKLHAYTGRDRYHSIAPILPKAKLPSYLPGDSILTQSMVVNSAHHQRVERLGRNLEVLQISADNVIETICHRSLPIIGLQWHPERLFVGGLNQLEPLIRELRPGKSV